MSDAGQSKKSGDAPAVAATAAVCGLYCDACSIYIGSHEDPKRLALFASRMGWSVEDAYCDGCRAERRTPYCRACTMYACALGRGLDFCSECADFPCAELEDFQRERPHRIELYDCLARIGEVGVGAWMEEARQRYACPSCSTLNSAYDLKCRHCGYEPANAYVAAHRAAIVERLSQT